MLSPAEVDLHRRQGYLTGFHLCSPTEMAALRSPLDTLLREEPNPDRASLHRHLDRRLVFDLCANPAIVERGSSLLGPDLLIWHSRFFDKLVPAAPRAWRSRCASPRPGYRWTAPGWRPWCPPTGCNWSGARTAGGVLYKSLSIQARRRPFS